MLNFNFCDYICEQLKTNHHILTRMHGRKLAMILLISICTIGAFATLGDGKIKKDRPSKSLLTNKSQANSFSLRSGYTFRGTQVINTTTARYFNLNTTISYQKGNTTYTLPLKKRVLLGNVKIDIGNRQFRRN